MAAFTDQFERWPIELLLSPDLGSIVVSRLAWQAFLMMVDKLDNRKLAANCRFLDSKVLEDLGHAAPKSEEQRFQRVFQIVDQAGESGHGFPFGERPEVLCASVVFWNLVDAIDCEQEGRISQALTHQATAIDFLAAGIRWESQIRISDETNVVHLRKRYDAKKREADLAHASRWAGRDEMIVFAVALAKERVWDSVQQAVNAIYPKVKGKFPQARFDFTDGAVKGWIARETKTVRKITKGRKKI